MVYSSSQFQLHVAAAAAHLDTLDSILQEAGSFGKINNHIY
jgi:hypothetical protein